MSIDPTRIDIEFDPQRQHMVGVSAHGYQRFDVPFISEVLPDLWLGGCEDGLILPGFIKNLVSLYPVGDLHRPPRAAQLARGADAATASTRPSTRWTTSPPG